MRQLDRFTGEIQRPRLTKEEKKRDIDLSRLRVIKIQKPPDSLEVVRVAEWLGDWRVAR